MSSSLYFPGGAIELAWSVGGSRIKECISRSRRRIHAGSESADPARGKCAFLLHNVRAETSGSRDYATHAFEESLNRDC